MGVGAIAPAPRRPRQSLIAANSFSATSRPPRMVARGSVPCVSRSLRRRLPTGFHSLDRTADQGLGGLLQVAEALIVLQAGTQFPAEVP